MRSRGCAAEVWRPHALPAASLPQKLSLRMGLADLTQSGLPSLACVEVDARTLALLPELPGVTRLELAGRASRLASAHIDALARLPQLACLVHRPPFFSKDAEQAAVVLRKLRRRLPRLAIEEKAGMHG